MWCVSTQLRGNTKSKWYNCDMEFGKDLNIGLQRGFAGGIERGKKSRHGWGEVEFSHMVDIVDGKTITYQDEWVGNRAGGGQELESIDGKHFTRVYAGGVVGQEKLEKLGIKKKDVITFLKSQILEHGEELRLFSDFESELQGKWKYVYKILFNDPEIGVTGARESILYDDNLVFVHGFLLSPVE